MKYIIALIILFSPFVVKAETLMGFLDGSLYGAGGELKWMCFLDGSCIDKDNNQSTRQALGLSPLPKTTQQTVIAPSTPQYVYVPVYVPAPYPSAIVPSGTPIVGGATTESPVITPTSTPASQATNAPIILTAKQKSELLNRCAVPNGGSTVAQINCYFKSELNLVLESFEVWVDPNQAGYDFANSNVIVNVDGVDYTEFTYDNSSLKFTIPANWSNHSTNQSENTEYKWFKVKVLNLGEKWQGAITHPYNFKFFDKDNQVIITKF